MTQTPASGPFAPVTWPPIASALTGTTFFCCALAGPPKTITNAAIATPVRHALEWRRKVILRSQLFCGTSAFQLFRQCEILLVFQIASAECRCLSTSSAATNCSHVGGGRVAACDTCY